MAPARTVALLGGTTSLGDCLLAIAHLAFPARLVQGEALARYERAFAQEIGVDHGFAFSSGRVGLYGILRALGIGAGDEVLVQVPTHVVVANAVRYTGAKPVFVDCTAETFEMDLRDAERKIGDRTRALILQHTFGIPCDLDGALGLANRHDLVLIEDCVHALGARSRGRPLGSFGRAAFFSTEETKTISTTMGGMVTTADPELADAIREFQRDCSPPPRGLVARYLVKLVIYHALTEPHLHHYARRLYEALSRPQPLPEPTSPEEMRGERPPGYERRLANAQAAIGLRQLRRLQSNLRARARAAEGYRNHLREAGVEPTAIVPEREPAYVRFPLAVADRAAALRRLRGIAVVGLWFTSVLEESASPEQSGYVPGSCPTAELACRRLVNLPTHPRVRAADVQAIVAALAPLEPGAGVSLRSRV